MTSFIIKQTESRPLPAQWQTDPACPFCKIVRGDAPAYKLYENESVIAILDILPLRPGHALVIPKVHISRVSELPEEFAAECGKAVTRVARAISAAVENTALNVVCNQEYAQAVHHVHYHIIPAPRPGADDAPERGDHVTKALTEKEMFKLEFEARHNLQDESATKLAENIRSRF
ncbi:HIT-like protein [Trametes elegans]|nr:HIT-like protein [Trametes elegans]